MHDIIKNKDRIDEIAESQRFQSVTIERVLWMIRILQEMSKSDLLSKDFAIMGGSAIAFLYGNIYRLSVDIDLDYINNPNLGRIGSEEIIQLQNTHIKEFGNLAKILEIEFELGERKDRYLQVVLKYKSKYIPSGSVELDLGYKYCHSVLDLSKIPWPNNFNIDEFETFKIQTFPPEELWASKIIAMIGTKRIDTEEGRFLGFRNKIRHLYDIHYLIKNILPENNLDICLMKKLTILFGTTRVKLFELCRGDALMGHNQDEYEKYLRPVLRAEKYVYELLTMQRDVRTFLDENIFNYELEEIEFMQDFTNKTFRPNKIFDDKIANRLKKMFFYEEMLNMIKL